MTRLLLKRKGLYRRTTKQTEVAAANRRGLLRDQSASLSVSSLAHELCSQRLAPPIDEFGRLQPFFRRDWLREMLFERDDSGNWSINLTTEEQEELQRKGTECYHEAFQCYLTLLDGAFRKAKDASERAFIQTSKIQRDIIARGIFTSVNDLHRKIMRYIRSYNQTATPIKWSYKDVSNRIKPTSKK